MNVFKRRKRVIKIGDYYQCQKECVFGGWRHMYYHHLIDDKKYPARFTKKETAINFINKNYEESFRVVHVTNNGNGRVVEYNNILGADYVCQKRVCFSFWRYIGTKKYPYTRFSRTEKKKFSNKDSAIKFIKQLSFDYSEIVYIK